MKITEVRVFKKQDVRNKLRAFVTITIDDSFVIRDIKVIEGSKGLFVAMPSRKLKEPCPACNQRIELGSKFCSQCGSNIEGVAFTETAEGQDKQNQHKDVAHPISLECREYIQQTVLDAYKNESSSAHQHSSEPVS